MDSYLLCTKVIQTKTYIYLINFTNENLNPHSTAMSSWKVITEITLPNVHINYISLFKQKLI